MIVCKQGKIKNASLVSALTKRRMTVGLPQAFSSVQVFKAKCPVYEHRAE